MPPSTPLNEKIQNMLDELPESPGGTERRGPVLTKHDARWLANLALVISEHQQCHIGLSIEQATALKEMKPEPSRGIS